MSRSLKKGIFTDPKLLKKIVNLKPGDRRVIKTWSRDSVIAPEMVGFIFGVHNGRNFIEVVATENMVGHRLGEFSPTRKFTGHGGRMAKDLAKEAADKDAAAKKVAVAAVSAPAKK